MCRKVQTPRRTRSFLQTIYKDAPHKHLKKDVRVLEQRQNLLVRLQEWIERAATLNLCSMCVFQEESAE